MLDKNNSRKDTTRDKREESKMAVSARQVAVSEIEYAAKKMSSDHSIRENIKLSLADSKKGKVLTREQAIERLKKRAS